ncbi:bcl-2/adenovirus E1B 19 kDa-interacting protein 2-like protein isoform X1 [Ambystoma mexicanum]|uniref:bcl-2/adenovirus E1B 19 kDa-interacting protein 2-like protein isoform X1 n=2 Tax=Ambystoma mexicanum TaxID=8296 RepID=UPI0037E90844
MGGQKGHLPRALTLEVAPKRLPDLKKNKKIFEVPDPLDPGADRFRVHDMELKEEWQDEEFPRPLPEATAEESEEDCPGDSRSAPPNTLELCGNRHMRKRLPAPAMSFNLDRSDGSLRSGEGSIRSTEIADQTLDDDFDFDIDDLETPSGSEQYEVPESGPEFEWEDDLPRARGSDSSSAADKLGEGIVTDMEDQEGRKWRIFLMGGQEHKVDMTAIEPYKKVISHGGYYGDGLNAVIMFASCYLPASSIRDYQYIMDNLFRYIIGTLEVMVAENYMLVYLNGATPRSKIPTMGWIKQCYQTIDRRLKKNLKALIIVHPTWYVKAVMAIIRPFISSKFGRKVQFMNSLWELSQLISLDQVHIPECIRQLDQDLNG